MTVDADNHTAILLDTLLVTLFDTVGNCHCVAGAKLSNSFLGVANASSAILIKSIAML